MKTLITHAVPIVAAAYGEKFGIEVVFQGKQAKTDGKRIILPSVEITSEEDKIIMWGYLAHEAAHIRYTDFSVLRKINHPLKHALLNIVEDVRIELNLALMYPGTLKTINAVIERLVSTKGICYPKDDKPIHLLQMMCLLTLRLTYLKQVALTAIQAKVANKMQETFPSSFNHFLKGHFSKVKKLNSTHEALDWVDELMQKISSLSQDSFEPSDNITSAKNLNEEKEQKDFTKKQLEKLASDLLNTDKDDIIQDIFNKMANQINRWAKHSAKKQIICINDVDVAETRNNHKTLMQLQNAQKASSLLRIQLRNWLVALQQIKPAPRQSGQRLIPNRIALSQAGETRIFKQCINKVAPSADIHLLVDRSSSMNRIADNLLLPKSYNAIANESALALALALDGIAGISLAVTYFGKSSYTTALTKVLRPHERALSYAGRFNQLANGNTPMAEGIWFAVHDLLKLKAKRKIIIAITDGKPSMLDETKEVISLCEDNQFELIGIGIQEKSVKELFPVSLVITEVSQLKEKLFATIKKILVS